jgi:protein ImuA
MNAITPLAAFARPRPLRSGASLPHWRPGPTSGQAGAALHSEIFAAPGDACGAGLVLALALDRLATRARDPVVDCPDERPWLWVQDLPPGLRHRLIHVAAKTPEDALFALEEGLRCRDLAFVVGEIAGNPKALGFTASRRLSLATEKHGTPLWLIRIDAARDLSSARMRWNVCAAPSVPPRWNAQASGPPAWHAELFRARNHPPGEWILRDDGHVLTAQPPHHVDLAGSAVDRPLAAG